VIPCANQYIGFDFTNAIVLPQRFRKIKAIAITANIVDNGIMVEVRKIPHDVVAVQFMSKNLTTHDDDWTLLDSPIFVDDPTRNVDFVTYLDRSVQRDNVYLYTTKLIFRTGVEDQLGNEVIEYNVPNPGQVDVNVTGLSVTSDRNPNVTFDVALSAANTDTSHLSALLQQAGIKEYFNLDIAAQRDQLNSLLTYSVQRIDLHSGDREDFGVVSTLTFDDEALRKKTAAKQLTFGRRYRYIVSALLRAPETMFEKLQKTQVDEVSKKPYTFAPSKFLHPLALSRGVLVSPKGLTTRYAKQAMAHGEIGVRKTVEVDFSGQSAQVLDASVERFNRTSSIISWSCTGYISLIDHFVISKLVHGIKTIVGKAHSEFENGSCQWIHNLTSHDRGEVQYVITPVFNDYIVGSSSTTNTLVIEDV
jgi:hypothetical protein